MGERASIACPAGRSEPHFPPLPKSFEYRLDLGPAVTSRELKDAARHRWFYFPHSYSPRLVFQILDQWQLPESSQIADSFVGSGTSLLAARQRGMVPVGFDLSPLAVMITNAKVGCYDPSVLRRDLDRILKVPVDDDLALGQLSARLLRAFTTDELKVHFALLSAIRRLPQATRHFFLVALLWAARGFSRAVPDGGWFRWRTWPDRSGDLRDSFSARASLMIEDVQLLSWGACGTPRARLADARRIPVNPSSKDGFITSPPYANRHDYSRVFHIDLLLLGLSETSVTNLRHASIRSHVEAKAPSGYTRRLNKYRTPDSLQTILARIPSDADKRIDHLLKGYFQDLYLSLVEVSRILRPGGRAAFVVGNVRYSGTMVPVDEILGDLAPQTGMQFEKAWVVRLRGNSAQQMGQYGRHPARESVVFLAKSENK